MAVLSLVKRLVKGSALTATEHDANLSATEAAVNGKPDTSLTIATSGSLAGGGSLAANRTLSLVNDSTTPGATMLYGTDAGGVKGWVAQPAGGGGGGLTATTAFGAGRTNEVNRSLASRIVERINVLDYGATGNGATDDSTAIQHAFDAASALAGGGFPPEVFFPPGYKFRVNAQVTASGTFPISMYSPIVSGLSQSPATPTATLLIGVAGTTTYAAGLTFRLWLVGNSNASWATTNHIGCEAKCVLKARFHFVQVLDFTVAFKHHGDGNGSGVGSVIFDVVNYCQYTAWHTKTGTAGWNNSVDYYFNDIWNPAPGDRGGIYDNKSRYGLYAVSTDGLVNLYLDNINVHVGTFQLGVPTTGESVVYTLENVTQFRVIGNPRYEANTVVVRTLGVCRWIDVRGYQLGTGEPTFGVITFDDQSTLDPVSMRSSMEEAVPPTDWWHSGPLAERCAGNGTAGQVAGPGLFHTDWNVGATATFANTVVDHGGVNYPIEVTRNGLMSGDVASDFANYVGVLIDTSFAKTFAVSPQVRSTDYNDQGVHISVYAFDGSGNRLTGTAPRYVRGPDIAYGGGSYGYNFSARPANWTQWLTVHASVKKIFVAFLVGPNPLQSFSVGSSRGALTLSSQDGAFPLFSGRLASAVPDQGRFVRGESVGNTGAATGQPAARIPTATGWRAKAWVASTAVRVGYLRSNGGNIYEVITAGTTAASGGPTGTTSNITDGTAHWQYIGAQAAFTNTANL